VPVDHGTTEWRGAGVRASLLAASQSLFWQARSIWARAVASGSFAIILVVFIIRPGEVSRIAAMCGSLDLLALISSNFVSALGDDATGPVSVGRYALRGVGGAQHLFKVERGIQSEAHYPARETR
jgi:hypothetical protein